MKKTFLLLFALLPMMLSAQNLVPAQHKNGKWGYWGEETRREFGSGYPYTFEGFIIKPTFEAAYPFEIGRNSYRWYAFVKKKGLWGVINTNGKFVVKPKYTSVGKSNPYGIRVVGLNGKFGLAQGPNELSAIDYDSIDELCFNTHCGPYGDTPCRYRYLRTKREGKYGLLDFKDGRELCPAILDHVEIRELAREYFVLLVKLNGKYGLLCKDGGVIIPARYDSVEDFGWCNYSTEEERIYLVKSNGKYGLLKREGRMLVPVRYDKIEKHGKYGEFLIVELNGKHGLLDYCGEVIVAPKYQQLKCIGGELFAIYDGEWRFVNGSGSIAAVSGRTIYYTTNDGRPLNYKGSAHNLFCDGKGALVFDGTLTAIKDGTFSGCENLKSITIPNSVTEIGGNAFSGSGVIVENGVKYIGDYLVGVVDKTQETYTIRKGTRIILNCAFKDCKFLEKITIPNSVTSIGAKAFKDCCNLQKITIPNSVTSIGACAFDNCIALKSVCISDLSAWCKIEFEDYDASPFHWASNLYLNGALVTKLAIPSGITEIKPHAFYGCNSLINVTIPDTVTEIGNGAFSCCCSLKRAIIPNSVTSIGDTAFMGCDNLTSISIPDGVTEIGKQAFDGCGGLVNTTIPNSVAMIGKSAFKDCTGKLVVNCNISSVAIFQESAFYGSNFTDITIGDSVTSIGANAFYCTGVKEYEYDYDFMEITRAELLNDRYTLINGWRGTMTSITIGKSVTSIEKNAFVNWVSLDRVYCKAVLPPKSPKGMFEGCDIYVPRKSVNIYRTDPNWRDYNIIGYDF